MKTWRAWSGWRALFPKSCAGCGRQLGAQVGLCQDCRAALRPQVELHSPLRARAEPHLVTLGGYQGVNRRVVRELKFSRARELAQVLGGVLAAGVPAQWGVQAVIPVPLHFTRERHRGFNQAQLLGQAIATSLSVPCVHVLQRTRATRQQSRKHAADRADLHGVFVAQRNLLPAGPVLLVDDVLTTGRTLTACRDALLEVGAKDIYLAVIAR